jgi:hypothetical protein
MQEKLPKHPKLHKPRRISQFLQIRLTHKLSNPHTNKQEPPQKNQVFKLLGNGHSFCLIKNDEDSKKKKKKK